VSAARPYRGVLFDLFGTLIRFDAARLPVLEIDGERVHTTAITLADELAAWMPGVGVEELWRALLAVSDEMARARAYDHTELPSRERFRRALERLGCDDAVLAEASVHLSRAHMRLIGQATVLPPAHQEVIAAARSLGPVAVVSNFDDTGAAWAILRRHGLLPSLDAVVVSEALGLRKPHPALVRAALRETGREPADVLFVGDTFHEDVAAAHAAGVDSAWIDARAAGVPPAATPPTHVVRTLPELLPVLRR
jgi:putative hydrolase of the HAD superfamily